MATSDAQEAESLLLDRVGRVKTVRGWCGVIAVVMVLRATVARSASSVWKLCTGRPSSVRPMVCFLTAAVRAVLLHHALAKRFGSCLVGVVVQHRTRKKHKILISAGTNSIRSYLNVQPDRAKFEALLSAQDGSTGLPPLPPVAALRLPLISQQGRQLGLHLAPSLHQDGGGRRQSLRLCRHAPALVPAAIP